MNRLWIRLSIAFAVIVVFSILAIFITTGIIIRARLQSPVELMGGSSGTAEKLQKYYEAHHGWTGVEPFLAGMESGFSLNPSGRLHILLTSQDRRTIYRASVDGQPSEPSANEPGHVLITVPIGANKVIYGYFTIFELPTDASGDQPQAFEGLQTLILGVVTFGGGLGLVFGISVSRYLTAPLNQLAQAAQAIGERDLTSRVNVGGTQEVRAVAQSFNEMAEALQRAERQRQNLVADVAHELRTPLTVLEGSLLAILDNVYSLDKAEVARLYDQTRVLSHLVNDLHDLSLADARQLRLKVQAVNPTELISEVVQTFEPIAEAQGVTLEAQISGVLPSINGNPVRLKQVLHNLVMNALRYTPAEGSIVLGAAATVEEVQITVQDTGDGISAEHLPYVFDRFYRADPARSRESGGAGLGLAIVRAMVENHQGRITVTSDGIAGHGTTFTIWLPVATNKPTPPDVVSPKYRT